MKTTKKVFSALYGEIPEGATCHIKLKECASFTPCFQLITPGHKARFTEVFVEECGRWVPSKYSVGGPDISDVPAKTWTGFFTVAYDEYFDKTNLG
jgi:hypothetical protein